MPDAVLVLNHTWAPRQFIPGGTANRYVDVRLRRAVGISKTIAPHRTGLLSASTHKTGTLNRGALGAVGALYNDAPYARYVVKGTEGKVIGPVGPNPMPIPRPGIRLPYRYTGTSAAYFPVGPGHRKKFVKGQRANHFLGKAMDIAFETTVD